MNAETRLTLTGADDEPKPKNDGGDKPKRDRKGEEAPGARTRRRHESELRGRLSAVLDRLVETLEGRGDDELADAIREDAAAMVSGLVGITRPVTWLRGPILSGLAIVEPLLAFGRVGRIMAGRWNERRRTVAEERQAAEWQAEIERRAELQATAENPAASPEAREAAVAELRRIAEAGGE